MNEISNLILLLAIFFFIGVVCWTYNKKRKKRFQQDALIPFEDKDKDRDNSYIYYMSYLIKLITAICRISICA